MKVLGIIPARYASSRFPGKPLLDLKGKTMIRRVYEGAVKAQYIDRVIVATDDERILEEVKSFGGEAVLTSDLHPSGTDRCGEVASQHADYDVVINIQGDEPLVDFRQLDLLAGAFKNPGVNIATLGTRLISEEDLQNPNRIKIVTNHQKEALYFSRSFIPNTANFKGNAFEFYPFLRHIGLYAYRRETLLELISLEPTKLEQVESLEQLRWLYYGHKIHVVETDIETPNIDVPEDVEKVISML
ncbi:MAG: 3-deoxy-manno-octulosonate cytidylyltransferase [Crocinitomicaceae bacterium]|nr:3-deoxy-manno-octulosonate cytidylyltransferase [Crocinitomicaceae bacterium]